MKQVNCPLNVRSLFVRSTYIGKYGNIFASIFKRYKNIFEQSNFENEFIVK